MNNAIEQFKINLNQNLWGLLVAFVALGASEYFNLRLLFGFAILTTAIMTLSIAVTTLAYSVTYWRKRIDESATTDHSFASGWWRLWVFISIAAIVPIGYFVVSTLPGTATADESRVLESIEAVEIFLAKSQDGYKPAGAKVARTEVYSDLSGEEIVSRLQERYKGKVDFSSVEEMHRLRLTHIHSEWTRITVGATIFWAAFSVLLLVFGRLAGWVYRGFCAPT